MCAALLHCRQNEVASINGILVRGDFQKLSFGSETLHMPSEGLGEDV